MLNNKYLPSLMAISLTLILGTYLFSGWHVIGGALVLMVGGLISIFALPFDFITLIRGFFIRK